MIMNKSADISMPADYRAETYIVDAIAV